MILVEGLEGVRAAWRWILAGEEDLAVSAEADGVAGARAAAGEVLVAGLRLSDGTAADLCAGPRPVVVVTSLPADERTDVDLSRAAAVLRTGTVRATLASAVRAVVPRS